MERLLSSSSVAVAASRGGNWVGGSSGLWLVDWAPNAVWRTYGEIFGVSFGVFVAVISAFSYEYNCMQPSRVFRKKNGEICFKHTLNYILLFPLPPFFLDTCSTWFTFFSWCLHIQKRLVYIRCLMTSFFCLYYSWVAMMIELSIRELLHCTSIFGTDSWVFCSACCLTRMACSFLPLSPKKMQSCLCTWTSILLGSCSNK